MTDVPVADLRRLVRKTIVLKPDLIEQFTQVLELGPAVCTAVQTYTTGLAYELGAHRVLYVDHATTDHGMVLTLEGLTQVLDSSLLCAWYLRLRPSQCNQRIVEANMDFTLAIGQRLG